MIEANKKWLSEVSDDLLQGYTIQQSWANKYDAELQFEHVTHKTDVNNNAVDYVCREHFTQQTELMDRTTKVDCKPSKRFVVLAGIDGGHLVDYISTVDGIKHLVIVEPDINSFYHSLQTINWPAFFEKMGSNGTIVYMHLGPMNDDARKRFIKEFTQIGSFNIVCVNYVGDTKLLVKIMMCFGDSINLLGFYGDERVGLAHSLNKMVTGQKIWTGKNSIKIYKPIVVCGNGPSLASTIPYLKEHRDEIYLMSCGSTIGTLFNHGLKPDFQVEQERPKISSNWTKTTTTPEFRNGVTGLVLNVVHPQVNDLFDDLGVFLKDNDLGSLVISHYLKGAPRIMFVNPLAANAGASMASALGFMNIYLAGVDCAFGKNLEVHSSGSAYDGHHEEAVPTLQSQGNFGGTVSTNKHYFESARAFVALAQVNPVVNYYNMSDGLLIGGFKPAKEIQFIEDRSTKDQIMANFSRCEAQPNLDDIQNMMAMAFSEFRQVIDTIPLECTDKDEAYGYLEAVNELIWDLSSRAEMFWWLIKGSFSIQLYFVACMIEKDFSKWGESVSVLKSLVNSVEADIKGDFFRWSTWEVNGFVPRNVNESL